MKPLLSLILLALPLVAFAQPNGTTEPNATGSSPPATTTPLIGIPFTDSTTKAVPVTLTPAAGAAIPNYTNSPNYNPFVPVTPRPAQSINDKFAVGNVGKTAVAPGSDEAPVQPKENRDELQRIFDAWASQYSVDDKGGFAKRPSPVVQAPNEPIHKVIAPDVYLFDDFQLTMLKPDDSVKIGQRIPTAMVRDKTATVDGKIYPAFTQVAPATIPTQDQFLTALKAAQSFEVEVQETRPQIYTPIRNAQLVLTTVKYTVHW